MDKLTELKKGLMIRFQKDSIKGAYWLTNLYYENDKIMMWRGYFNRDLEEVKDKTKEKILTEKEFHSLYEKDQDYIIDEYYPQHLKQ